MHPPKNFIIEIATSDFSTTSAAVKGGADRIELCANLMEGGTTPSYGTIALCMEKFEIPIFPIIRPRGGDFLYSDEEFDCMKKDILQCKQLGCKGIVVGMLLQDGAVDSKRMEALVSLAHPMSVTFHRAFDRCHEPFKALEAIIELGCERILTSGQYPQAILGIELIKQLHETANGRIIIMPGSGVRKDTILTLAKETGCNEFHASLRRHIPSTMKFKHPNFVTTTESYTNNFIDAASVQSLRIELMKANE